MSERTDSPIHEAILREAAAVRKCNLILEELERICNTLSGQRDACFRRGLQDASSGYGEGASLTFRLLDAIRNDYLEEYVAESRAEAAT